MDTKSYFLNTDEITYINSALDYCNKHNLSLKEQLGNGQWGIAFLLSDGNVLKATTDPSETYNAIKLKDKKLENVTAIFDIDTYENIGLILQERIYTEKEGLRELYENTELKLSKGDQSFCSLDFELLKEYEVSLTKEEEKLAKELFNGINEIYRNGGSAEDVAYDNIGINKNNEYVLFDQKSGWEDPEEHVEKIKEYFKENKKRVKKLKI